jgi:uncharacterized membrane protein YagU involved in acid resistance
MSKQSPTTTAALRVRIWRSAALAVAATALSYAIYVPVVACAQFGLSACLVQHEVEAMIHVTWMSAFMAIPGLIITAITVSLMRLTPAAVVMLGILYFVTQLPGQSLATLATHDSQYGSLMVPSHLPYATMAVVTGTQQSVILWVMLLVTLCASIVFTRAALRVLQQTENALPTN